jgi:hypothetical protein
MKCICCLSPARWAGLVLLLGMAALLLFIGWRAEHDAPHLAQHLADYRTAKLMPQTHLSGNELSMVYMPVEKNTLNDCIGLCLENKACVAANHYLATPDKNAQCWLLKAIDPSKLDQPQACCTLAVIEKRLPPPPLVAP